jgi:hypothetical protein
MQTQVASSDADTILSAALHRVMGRAMPQIIHELANCANGLCGYTDLMQTATQASRQRDCLSKLQVYSDKLRHMIELLRAFNGADLTDSTPLVQMAPDLVEFLGWLGKHRGVKVHVRVDESLQLKTAPFMFRSALLVALEALLRSELAADLHIHFAQAPDEKRERPSFVALPEPELLAQLQSALGMLLAQGWRVAITRAENRLDCQLLPGLPRAQA